MRIADYVLVQATNPTDLETRVQNRLQNDWIPLGNPVVVFTGGGGSPFRLFQAMIRYP